MCHIKVGEIEVDQTHFSKCTFMLSSFGHCKILCHHWSNFVIANALSCVVSVDYLSSDLTNNTSMKTVYLAVVSTFSKSCPAWDRRVNHWTYTCTIVAFHFLCDTFLNQYHGMGSLSWNGSATYCFCDS